MSSKTTDINNPQITELNNKLEEKDKIIEDLKNELKEEKLISSKTKEYLFILENKNSIKDKEIKKLKKEIKKIKNTTSWKITKPLRKVGNLRK